MKRVNVIGGGAAGMMAAITAARAGASVSLFEQNGLPGNKLLSTGNGRCNFTNKNMDSAFFRGENPSFVLGALSQFSGEDAVRFFSELGMEAKVKNGYVYPRCMQAATVRNMLLSECRRLCADIRTDERAEKKIIDRMLSSGESVIICTGGMAAPKTGSDGCMFSVLKEMGVRIIEPLPALVPLVSKDIFLKSLSGVRSECAIDFYVENECVCRSEGEIQFTDYGISGIVVFDGSRYIARGLHNLKKCHVVIDFLPEYPREEALALSSVQSASKSASTQAGTREDSIIALSGLFNDKLAKAIMRAYDNARGRAALIDMIKSCRIDITGTKDFDRAQVTSGGVDTAFIDPATMEHKKIPGLYFAGEVLDVDAICGGYNLQWAWSSGFVAGKSAAG